MEGGNAGFQTVSGRPTASRYVASCCSWIFLVVSEAPVFIITLPTGGSVVGKRDYTVDSSEREFDRAISAISSLKTHELTGRAGYFVLGLIPNQHGFAAGPWGARVHRRALGQGRGRRLARPDERPRCSRGCPKCAWISFDLSATVHCPSTRRCRVHHAEIIWIGPCWAARSSERRSFGTEFGQQE